MAGFPGTGRLPGTGRSGPGSRSAGSVGQPGLAFSVSGWGLELIRKCLRNGGPLEPPPKGGKAQRKVSPCGSSKAARKPQGVSNRSWNCSTTAQPESGSGKLRSRDRK
eukprot:3232660-Heterocapsa_arctica.AAC.1